MILGYIICGNELVIYMLIFNNYNDELVKCFIFQMFELILLN